jgi:hypothetical protein
MSKYLHALGRPIGRRLGITENLSTLTIDHGEQANLINIGAESQPGAYQNAKSSAFGVNFIISRRIVFR